MSELTLRVAMRHLSEGLKTAPPPVVLPCGGGEWGVVVACSACVRGRARGRGGEVRQGVRVVFGQGRVHLCTVCRGELPWYRSVGVWGGAFHLLGAPSSGRCLSNRGRRGGGACGRGFAPSVTLLAYVVKLRDRAGEPHGDLAEGIGVLGVVCQGFAQNPLMGSPEESCGGRLNPTLRGALVRGEVEWADDPAGLALSALRKGVVIH